LLVRLPSLALASSLLCRLAGSSGNSRSGIGVRRPRVAKRGALALRRTGAGRQRFGMVGQDVVLSYCVAL